MMEKYCTYCRKLDHNDSECWSTRPADWKSESFVPSSIVGMFYTTYNKSHFDLKDIVVERKNNYAYPNL